MQGRRTNDNRGIHVVYVSMKTQKIKNSRNYGHIEYNGNMNKIHDKIRKCTVSDSEIIQEMESAKREDPKFDINWTDKYGGWSLLLCAAICYREELVRYFLTYSDINVNYKDDGGYTSLHFAHGPILKLLLDHRDIDVNIQNDGGWTGLHRVCYWGRKACVREYLIDARVDILIRSKWEKIARDYAIKQGYIGIANMLKKVLCTSLLRIPNDALCRDVVRMIIEEYT